ncbi:hypothetical protein HY495_01305 [Candidatus Woesearchaeota archaeon]|nr:hypothetical protein [Candidatus Woesearchaeota archaeon]
MKKTLIAVAAAGLLALGCRGDTAYETNGSCSYAQDEHTEIPTAPPRTLDDLLKQQTLTKEEFALLIRSVNSLSNLETILKQRKIAYPPEGTKEHEETLSLRYGAPWLTHNRGYGVCDEMAMYSLPFLLQIPEVKDVTLIEIKGTVEKEGQPDKLGAVHALVIFRDSTNKWRYFNSGGISSSRYEKPLEAVNTAAMTDNRYKIDNDLTYKSNMIKGLSATGSWVYDNQEAEKIRPLVEIYEP